MNTLEIQDFSTATDEQLLGFVVANSAAFGGLVDDFESALRRAIDDGASCFLRRQRGFALVRKERPALKWLALEDRQSELTLLYVDPSYQRRGVGGDLVREAKARFLLTMPMRLDCDREREPIFVSYGFEVTGGTSGGEYLVMECQPSAVGR